MTETIVRALPDSQLDQVLAWAQDEKKERIERHKRETIARIKEMAGEVGISVSIAGTRGRPKGGRREAGAQAGEGAAAKSR